MCDCAYGCLKVPTAIRRCLMVSVEAYWCLRVPTGVKGCLLLVSEGN